MSFYNPIELIFAVQSPYWEEKWFILLQIMGIFGVKRIFLLF